MFKEIKEKEHIDYIALKLAQIDAKLNDMNKLLKELQKSVKTAENKPK